MLIQAIKDTKFKKLCFNGHPSYTSNNVHKHTGFVYIYIYIFSFYFEKQTKWRLNNQTKIDKQHEGMKIDADAWKYDSKNK